MTCFISINLVTLTTLELFGTWLSYIINRTGVAGDVRYHMSRVWCHMSHFFIIIIIFFGQSGGVSCWRVCYQRGLPRLFFMYPAGSNTYLAASVC